MSGATSAVDHLSHQIRSPEFSHPSNNLTHIKSSDPKLADALLHGEVSAGVKDKLSSTGLLNNMNNVNEPTPYEKAMNNISSAYDISKHLIYAKELESIQSLNQEKKTKIFQDSAAKPLLLLTSNQLSRVIFFHRKQLKKLKKKKMMEEQSKKNLEIIKGVNQRFGSFSQGVLHDTRFGKYRPWLGTQEQGDKKGFFMTDVNHIQQKAQEKEAADRIETEINDGKKKPSKTYKVLPRVKRKPGLFFNKTETKKEPWKRRHKPKFIKSNIKLKIDARVNKIPKFSRRLTQKEKMLRIYNPKNMPQGNNFFVPTMPIRRHPQLKKIEAYFSDCADTFIPATPQVKIPTMFKTGKPVLTSKPLQSDSRAPDSSQKNNDNLQSQFQVGNPESLTGIDINSENVLLSKDEHGNIYVDFLKPKESALNSHPKKLIATYDEDASDDLDKARVGTEKEDSEEGLLRNEEDFGGLGVTASKSKVRLETITKPGSNAVRTTHAGTGTRSRSFRVYKKSPQGRKSHQNHKK